MVGFNERYGPPGDACAAQWHPEFRVGTVYRCEIINYGERPVFSVSMSFSVEFCEAIETNQTLRLIQAARVVRPYDRRVTLAGLGPGSRFVFYAHNGGELFAAIGIPSVALYMTLGENTAREHPLLPPKVAVLSFPPSEVVAPPQRNPLQDICQTDGPATDLRRDRMLRLASESVRAAEGACYIIPKFPCFGHSEFDSISREGSDASSNRSASRSNSAAVLNRASQMTGLPAPSANPRYQAGSSRKRRGSFGLPSLIPIVVTAPSPRQPICSS